MENSRKCAWKFRLGAQLALLGALAAIAAKAATIGPDAFGYIANDATAYSFVDISSTGVAVLAGADDDTALVNIGFPFFFYGQRHENVCIGSNGLLTFGGCNIAFANQDLTATRTPGDYPTIAPLWFDLTFAARGAGAVYYQTLGEQGDRQFVVQWQNGYPLNGAKGITFQAILYETGGRIRLQYLDIDAGAGAPASLGGSATVGIRDAGGHANGRCLQWSHKVPVLHNEQAILFVPDAAGPVISGMPAPGMELWPPNNKLETVATVTASDAVTSVASFTVTAVSSELPQGKDPDIVITGGGTEYVVQLRAFRDAKLKGRTYTITATARDGAGNETIATATVTVPLKK